MVLWLTACAGQDAAPILTVTPIAPTAIATLQAPAVFSGDLAYRHVLSQMSFGPRPSGSAANRATADYIIAQLQAAGWSAETQTFVYRGVEARNIIGRRGGEGEPIIIGAHFDTRPAADQDKERPAEPVPGANDGASGVAVLLELARVLDVSKVGRPVWLAFFDAEDRGRLEGWDWSVGAGYMASHLNVTARAAVVIDMIGDADQQIYMEAGSDAELSRQIWEQAAALGYTTFIPSVKWNMVDDHVAFRERGIPAVLLIDFDYPYWHTTQDTTDKVSADSLERVGRTLQGWLEAGGK